MSAANWLTDADPRALRPDLDARVHALQSRAEAACPGRTAALVSIRIAQLLGTEPPDSAVDAEQVRSWYDSTDFDEGERALLGIVEQFVIDVHGVSDEQFATLRRHYSDPEILAIFYHASLADGFAKMARALLPPEG